jgi:hypothetical protein
LQHFDSTGREAGHSAWLPGWELVNFVKSYDPVEVFWRFENTLNWPFQVCVWHGDDSCGSAASFYGGGIYFSHGPERFVEAGSAVNG